MNSPKNAGAVQTRKRLSAGTTCPLPGCRPYSTKRGIRMTTVTHEIDGKVGVVTLAKPPHNLIDDQLINDLVAAYRKVVADGCRAILLRSSMRHFCAGAEMQSWGTGTRIHTDQLKLEAMLQDLEDVPVPTVAAVNGGALGGGLELALTCDMM